MKAGAGPGSQGRFLLHRLLRWPVGTDEPEPALCWAGTGPVAGGTYLGLRSRAVACTCSAPTDSSAMALTVSASSASPAWASRKERPSPAANLCTQLQCLPAGTHWVRGTAEPPPDQAPTRPHIPWISMTFSRVATALTLGFCCRVASSKGCSWQGRWGLGVPATGQPFPGPRPPASPVPSPPR